jgi:glutamine cyclotransferase
MTKKRPTGRTGKSGSAHKRTIILLGIAASVLVLVALLLMLSWSRSNPQDRIGKTAEVPAVSNLRPRQVSYEVVNSYPHDPTSFTQGLLWKDGGFYESTGLYGHSKLRRLEFPSGKVVKEISLAPELFGEGLALVDDRLIQLTWKSHRGFVYDRESFRVLQEFKYDTEGWGLTYDGQNLILSDGSSDLFYLDPQTFKPVRKLAVTMSGSTLDQLNELEFIEGEIWANVWQTDWIVRIDPSSGKVKSFMDLKGILAPTDRTGGEDAVLNGIAYDAEKKRIFITGKLWPRIFEIKPH